MSSCIKNRVQIAFNYDTTGSMSPCIREVRIRVEDVFTTLFKDIPGLEVALGANGDYFDRDLTYVTQWQDFTTHLNTLCTFVRNVRNTNGGDSPECYELVLHQARSLSWTLNATKLFVLVADAVPHDRTDPQNRIYNVVGLDWRAEARELAKNGIRVCAVQCLGRIDAIPFYRELAEITGGYHLYLDQFSEIIDLVKAICYSQGNSTQLRAWEQELERSGRMTRVMDQNFAKLGRRPVSNRFARHRSGLEPVHPGRFQMLSVLADCSIREFVESNDLLFKPGRGFYELTKSELVQEKKEVVLRDKRTGDMFSGDRARAMIDLRPRERARVKPAHLNQFDVFIQSTSYNRKLIGGTRFLYEVDPDR